MLLRFMVGSLLGWVGYSERDRSRDEGPAFRIDRLDAQLVLAARQADENDRVATPVVRPLPRKVVERDVEVPYARRDATGGGPADRNDAKVRQAVWNEDHALSERPWQWGQHGQ